MGEERGANSVTIELPAGFPEEFAGTPEAFVDEFRLAAAIEWCRQGRVSQGRGAELAGLDRSGFLDALAQAKVSACQVTADEVIEEVSQALGRISRRGHDSA